MLQRRTHALASGSYIHMIKKKQLMVKTGDEGLTAAAQFYARAA
jgi:hypothetical protein